MKNNITTIYVIRHGESEGNVQAQTDHNTLLHDEGLGSPLTERGKEQAKKLREVLKPIKLAAAFSSDLIRAKETAEILAKPHNVPVITDGSIRERKWGKIISKGTRLQIETALRDLNDEEKLAHRYFPEGETGLEAVQRLIDFLEEIIPVYNGKTIAVINHGNVMRSFLVKEKFAKYDELPSGSIENTAYFVLETDGKTYKIKETDGIEKNKKLNDEE
ncbi:MAG: histidine phosphatase family protein [Candidatus Levyibacteriota bacterium]